MKRKQRKLLKSEPVIDYLSEPGTFADNELVVVFKDLKIAQLLQEAGFDKRTGCDIVSVTFALFIWPLLNVNSIASFCGKQLKFSIKGGKSVLYDFRKRQNLAWRHLRMAIAYRIYC